MRAIASSVVLIYSQIVFADGNLKQQHDSVILSIQQREIVSREQIAQEQTRIESLKHEIQSINNELANASNEKYALLGVDEQGLKKSEQELIGIKQNLQVFSTYEALELLKNRSRIDDLKLQIESFKKKRISRVSSIALQIQSCELLLQKCFSTITLEEQNSIQNQSGNISKVAESSQPQIIIQESTKPESLIDSWIVRENETGRESLYKIASYPEVYGDPEKWPVLYNANKELIDQNFKKFTKKRTSSTEVRPQDILFPGQILKIPR